jgi:hypothetical protein
MKNLFAFALLFICCNSLNAQTFVAPIYPEIIYPTVAMNAIVRPQHVSCYGIASTPGSMTNNFLRVHSWNCIGASTNFNGIAWRRTNMNNTATYDLGYVSKFGDIYDLEVGIISTTNQTFVIASYWTGNGCYYDIYKWDPTGLSPSSLNNLISLTGKHPRMDSHKSYGIAITWEDTDGIRVKVFNTSVVNTLQIGDNRLIENTANCIKPDVAFAHATSDLLVRVAYVNPAGDVYVVNKSFNTILGTTFPSIAFNTDDIQTGINPGEIDIDCPDHPSEDNWSYIYSQGNVIRARLKTVGFSAAPFTINVSDASINTVANVSPTIAYANDGQSIYYGWATSYATTPTPGYIAVERAINGGYITPFSWYNRVTTSTTFPSGSPFLHVAFSKQNDESPAGLFAAYSMHALPTDYEMRTKIVPWPATSFRPGNTTEVENVAQQDISVSATPSPFHQEFSINIPNDNNSSIYSVAIIDLSGRIVRKLNGNLSTINAGLKGIGSEMLAGIYIVDIHAKGVNKTIKVIKE